MSRLEVPLVGKTVWATRDVLLKAELDLLIQDTAGTWKPETFLVDPGTEITLMAAARAKALALPLPRTPSPGGLIIAGAKREVRAGLIRSRIVGLDATEFSFPCYFVGDPDVVLDPSHPPPIWPKNLLGLTGVIDKIQICFAGRSPPGAPYGVLVVETI